MHIEYYAPKQFWIVREMGTGVRLLTTRSPYQLKKLLDAPDEVVEHLMRVARCAARPTRPL